MKTIIRKTYKAYRNMKRILEDPSVRDYIESALGFGGMFVILFYLSIMF